MAKKSDFFNLWLPVGIGIFFCGAALRWPGSAPALMGLGIGIIFASFINQYARTWLALLIGATIGALVYAGFYAYDYLHQDPDTASLDNEISFSCELMAPPKSLDGNSNESVWVYILKGPPPNLAHAWGYIGVPAGSPAPEPSNVDQKIFSISKCSITNYSNESLIGVYTTLSAYFFPLKKINNGWRVSQNPLSSEQIKTPTFNVPPATSPNNTQFFYISNPTPYFVKITIPTEVTLLDNGSTNEKTVNLIPLTELSVPGLWPGIPPTNPPTLHPATPTPQPPQSGK